MQLYTSVARRDWVALAGYAFYVAALTGGYYYNLTFVQLGLVDLGTRLVGMSRADVSQVMALLAVTALAVAIATGLHMDRRGWGADLRTRLRVLTGVIGVQLLLTVVAASIRTPSAFVVWVLVCSTTLGIGMPVMFSTMMDCIPVRDRGPVAATVAGLSFFIAALYPFDWRVEDFSRVLAVAMAPAFLVLAVVSIRRFRFIDALARQHQAFGAGRFCRPGPEPHRWLFAGLVAVMFAVFFVDSLGFLRIIEMPALQEASWQSPDVGVRLFIAVAHVLGALVAGVLYTNLGRGWLLVWIFGLFAFTHLLYTYWLGAGSEAVPPLALPFFYVLAVSFYTTLNFALWPDHATPQTIGVRTALGVGIAGWLASFLSTALALYSEEAGVGLLEHLRYVNALALLLLGALPLVLYVRRMVVLARRWAPS